MRTIFRSILAAAFALVALIVWLVCAQVAGIESGTGSTVLAIVFSAIGGLAGWYRGSTK